MYEGNILNRNVFISHEYVPQSKAYFNAVTSKRGIRRLQKRVSD